jgi:hypothetical protein
MKVKRLAGSFILFYGLFLGLSSVYPDAREEAARADLDALYKGDYRAAFVEKKAELFLKHIADEFSSTSVEGFVFDAKAIREFFPQMIGNILKVIEHNVTIEDVKVLPNGNVSAIVTLYTVIEFRKAQGQGSYLVTTVGTYRDIFRKKEGVLFEVSGDQLRNQTITALKP